MPAVGRKADAPNGISMPLEDLEWAIIYLGLSQRLMALLLAEASTGGF